jgi:YbgC/YbaW family acyl-CoA thioester hydrolase
LTRGPAVVQRVRWSDVDKMDVMYYGAYLRHTDAAEAEFFRALGFTYDDLHAQHGVWLARVNLEVRYAAPARLDDDLVTYAEPTKVGASSIHLSFPIERQADGKRVADVRLVLATLDAASLTATRLPAPLRAALHGGTPI